MPFTLSNPLCLLDDVKSALRLVDDADDVRLQLSIDAASRQIERRTGRRFWQDTSASARIFVAQTPFLCEIDDVQDLSGFTVKTDPYGDGSFALTWQALDYQLEPLNALVEGHPWPYTKIRAVRSLLFPVYGGLAWPMPFVQALTQVTAKWGWTAVPTDVRKAAVVQSIALFKADDVPFGATPFAETGIVRLRETLHPTAAALIAPYTETAVRVA